jgi:hypothetical protein
MMVTIFKNLTKEVYVMYYKNILDNTKITMYTLGRKGGVSHERDNVC